MKKKHKIFFIILSVFISESCSPDNQAFLQPQIVLIGNTERGGVDATLYRTSELNSDTYENITDARMLLLEDGVMLFELLFDDNRYHTDFQPVPGRTYRLEAHLEDHPAVYVETKIPEPVPFEVTGIDTIIQDYMPYLVLQITFTDPAGEENYYSLDARAIQPVAIFSNAIQKDPIFDRYPLPFDRTAKITRNEFTDQSIDGQRYTIDFYLGRNLWVTDEPDTVAFEIRFRMLGRSFYWMLRTSLLQGVQLTDPFSEPVQVYSDAVNGLGGFQAATDVTDTIWCRRTSDGYRTIISMKNK